MPSKSTLKITADVDPKNFSRKLKAALKSEGSFHLAMASVLSDDVAVSLGHLKDKGKIINFRVRAYRSSQRGMNSLKDAVKQKNGYVFWYLQIDVTTSVSTRLTEKNIAAPKTLKWKPIHYGYGVERYFKFKVIKQKMQTLYRIEFLKLHLEAKFLEKAHRSTSSNCKCHISDLRPVISGVWDWHIHFVCSGCGEKYLCQCFKKAFGIQARLNEKWKSEQPKDHFRYYELNGWPTVVAEKAEVGASYRKGICHLCTKTPSNIHYCSSMYGSEIRVKYGPYIVKTSLEKGISEREAENQIRELIGVPKIGEGWVAETELYKTICFILGAKYEVNREASPKWLGRQRLDIFIPSLNLAIEYHGQQHFRPVEYFGGQIAFHKVVERDKLKKRLCEKNGVKLLVFKYSENLTQEIVKKKILSLLKRKSF